MQTSWGLCNNIEIPLWLWKVWSVVVCSQNSFYVGRARKDNNNRQNMLLLCKKKINFWPDKQLFIDFLSRSKNNCPPITVTRTRKGQNNSKYGINVSVSYWLMIWATYSIFKSLYSLLIYFQALKINQLTVNLPKIMIVSVSNDRIQWTLIFGPDSVTIAVFDLVQNITISSQEIPLASWQLLLSERQDLLDNPLSRVPITQNQKGTMEMRVEVLSSVGSQDLDTSSYQVSDLEDIKFKWENS